MGDVTRNFRTYDHFCAVARALEQVGDRWSLLVIRDLLTGAKRFTDLTGRLGGITPKTLSQRLRELEDAGIVTADRQPGRREGRYRPTTARAPGDPEPARWHFRLDGADYLADSDGQRWSLTTTAPSAPADVTITATTQALTALIFAGSDAGIDITGETAPVQRFRQLISTLATVVHPA